MKRILFFLAIIVVCVKLIQEVSSQTVKVSRFEHKGYTIDHTTNDFTMSDWNDNSYVVGSAIKAKFKKIDSAMNDSLTNLKNLIPSEPNITNWNTAYLWGNHGSVGYITKTDLSVTTSGTGSASYNNSTGVINIPINKRTEAYSGSTDGSGNYTVVFSTPFSVAPIISANIFNPASNLHFCKITSCSTTGFTINAYGFSSVSSLPILGVLSGALVGVTTSPVSGATIYVTVIEK